MAFLGWDFGILQARVATHLVVSRIDLPGFQSQPGFGSNFILHIPFAALRDAWIPIPMFMWTGHSTLLPFEKELLPIHSYTYSGMFSCT